MKDCYKQLESALDKAKAARAHIAQNRGYDKELAREGYEHVVGMELIPAMLVAFEHLCEDLDDARKVERLAEYVIKQIKSLEARQVKSLEARQVKSLQAHTLNCDLDEDCTCEPSPSDLKG